MSNAASASRPGFIRLLLVAVACFACLSWVGLTGCASEKNGADVAPDAAVEETAEHEAVTLRFAVPVELQGLVQELADGYAADKDWLTCDVKAYESAKKLNAAITPRVEAPVAEGEAAARTDEAPVDESTSTDVAEEEVAVPLLPEADIVFEASASGMDSAEKLGAADPATRSEMIEDSLVIVASSESKLASVTIANIEAGSYPLAVVTGKGVYAKRQFEVLAALGAYADGAYAGYYASHPDAIFECEDTASVFASVSKLSDMVAIVKKSDVYRYGGVKVVGTIPAQMYTAIRYPHALGANLALLENGEAVQESAHDFLTWVTTSEEGARIVDKWGLRFTA